MDILKTPLNNAASDGPVNMTIETSGEAFRTIQHLRQSLAFFSTQLADGKLMKSDVQTHMSLIRQSYDDMARLLNHGDVLSKELEETQALCRAANQRCRELEQQLGQSVTAKAVEAGLKRLITIFEAWYELAGFHYAKIEVNPYGCLLCDFSSQIALEETRRERNRTDEYRQILENKVPYLFKDTPDKKFDLQKDTYHNDLMDTDNNKKLLTTAFNNWFPNSSIYGYKTRKDRGQFLLSVQIRIEFQDIENLVKTQEESKNADRP